MVKSSQYLTFLLALLAGCRSERVAFQFQPGPASSCVGPVSAAPDSVGLVPAQRGGAADNLPTASPHSAARTRRPGPTPTLPPGAGRQPKRPVAGLLPSAGRGSKVAQRCLRKALARPARQGIQSTDREPTGGEILLALLSFCLFFLGLLVLLFAAIFTSATVAYIGLGLVGLAAFIFFVVLRILSLRD